MKNVYFENASYLLITEVSLTYEEQIAKDVNVMSYVVLIQKNSEESWLSWFIFLSVVQLVMYWVIDIVI